MSCRVGAKTAPLQFSSSARTCTEQRNRRPRCLPGRAMVLSLLLAKSFEENGAALLIGRIAPGVALRPLDDPAGQRIACCLQRLAHVPASSVRGSLPSGLERLDALIAANALHVRALSPSLRRHQDRIIALAMPSGAATARKSAPSYFTVTFMPVISCSAVTMNSWRSTRRKHLASRSKTSGTPPRKMTGGPRPVHAS